MCKYCRVFYSRYQCSRYLGECDCPKCAGYCESEGEPQNAEGR